MASKKSPGQTKAGERMHHEYAVTGKPPGYGSLGKPTVKQRFAKGGHVKPRGRG